MIKEKHPVAVGFLDDDIDDKDDGDGEEEEAKVQRPRRPVAPVFFVRCCRNGGFFYFLFIFKSEICQNPFKSLLILSKSPLNSFNSF